MYFASFKKMDASYPAGQLRNFVFEAEPVSGLYYKKLRGRQKNGRGIQSALNIRHKGGAKEFHFKGAQKKKTPPLSRVLRAESGSSEGRNNGGERRKIGTQPVVQLGSKGNPSCHACLG